MQRTQLKPTAFGLALGVLWSLMVLIVGLVAHFYTYGAPFVNAMGTIYFGYEASVIGSLIGAIIAFIDAFLIGALFAWLYNVFAGFRKSK